MISVERRRFMKKRVGVLILAGFLAISGVSFAHSGRTDSSGGHKDKQNKSGLGPYHYHCGGNPAHLHDNGICPYASSSSVYSVDENLEQNKKVQEKLNELGYDCGKADGKIGKKTKEALKKFQKDHELTADGVIGPKTLEALGL